MKKIFKILVFFLGGCIAQGCAQESHLKSDQKIAGISLVSSPEKLQQDQVTHLQKTNANYVAVMPMGFVRSLKHPEISYDNSRQWFGETKAGIQQYIALLHKNNLNVMLKPQLWIWHGEYTGNLKMTNEKDWKDFEEAYREFILGFAEIAQKNKVELFCIGTELESFIQERPDFWPELIPEIKQKYHGKLTYAANWDAYQRIPFWQQLDYIGVDAYFPVSEEKTPTVENASQGWQTWKKALADFSAKTERKILFTEVGYRSVDFAGKEPWKSDRSLNTANLKAQENLLQAFFEEIWSQPWFAGGFIWKWHAHHRKRGGTKNTRFTPQNKPAEKVIAKGFSGD